MTTLKFINSLNETKYNSILKHLDRDKRPTPDFDLLGYDVEYDTQHDYQLLSEQFSWFDKKGKRQSGIFFEKEVSVLSLVGMIRGALERPLKPMIILVSYFSTAEISQITNAMKDFALTPYNRALDAEAQLQSDPETVDYDMGITGKRELGEHEDKLTLRISDLGGFFRGGLDKVGKAIGLKKITLDKIEKGKDEEYWKNNMGELLRKHKSEFVDYALRDAEIAVEAYKRLRDFFLQHYKIDVTGFKTASSLSSYLFRKNYLSDGFRATPITEIGGEYYEHDPEAETETERWKKRTRILKVIRYDLHQVRYYAMLSYWGGRAEAYGRGLTREDADLVLYDVDSLYPSSACLQPLPNSETKWVPFDDLRQADGLEGFACVSFDFSESEKETFYPCLPVMGFKTGKLYFPMSGDDAWCTLSEVREAVRLGGKSCIKSIYGVGFEPDYTERNHPLRDYMREFMKLKRDPKIKDTYEYELYKLLLNGPIGKFWETEKDFLTHRILRKYRTVAAKWSVEKDVPELYNDWSRIRQKVRKRVGAAWWPEAASLILGKARSLMSQFISRGALMSITDSVLLPKKTSIECPALTQLKRVESKLDLKAIISQAWILRTKVYALWKDNGKIAKVARHAWDIEEDDFKEWIRSSVARGQPQPTPEWAKHPVRVGQVVRTGRFQDFGKWYPRSHQNPPSLSWDGKRVNDDVNDEADLFKPGSFQMLAPLPRIEERVRKPGWPKGKPRRPNAEGLVPEAFRYTHNNSQLFDDLETGRSSQV